MGGVGFSLRDGGREIDAGGRTIPFAMISEAEMLALHDLLESAIGNGIKELTAYSDSTLIVGIFEAGGQCSLPHLLGIERKTRSLIARLLSFKIHHIPREYNKRADAIANCATANPSLLPQIIIMGGARIQ